MSSDLTFIPIERNGTVDLATSDVPVELTDVLKATADLYERAGFAPPWISYVAVRDGCPVGTCAFKSAPVQGRVEIAYFTFPAFERCGIATEMAATLLVLANRTDPAVTVTAQTLPERNASHRVLEKLDFARSGTIEHPEDGTVLEWQRSNWFNPARAGTLHPGPASKTP